MNTRLATTVLVAVSIVAVSGQTPDRTQRLSVSGGTSIMRATSAAVTSAIRAGTLAAGAPRASRERKAAGLLRRPRRWRAMRPSNG